MLRSRNSVKSCPNCKAISKFPLIIPGQNHDYKVKYRGFGRNPIFKAVQEHTCKRTKSEPNYRLQQVVDCAAPGMMQLSPG